MITITARGKIINTKQTNYLLVMKQNIKLLLLITTISCLSDTTVLAENIRDVSLNKTINEPGPLKGIVLWNDNGKINSYKNSISLEFSY